MWIIWMVRQAAAVPISELHFPLQVVGLVTAGAGGYT